MPWIQFTQTYSRPTSETRAIKYHFPAKLLEFKRCLDAYTTERST